MRTLISLIVASAFVTLSPLAQAEAAPAEQTSTGAAANSATSGNSAEAIKSTAPANTVESAKPKAESELPTCIPK